MKKSTTRRGGKFILLGLSFLLIAVMVFALYNSILKKPDLITHKKVQNYAVFKNHTAPLWAVQFSPDGKLIASGGVDSTVKIWRRDSGNIVHNLNQPMGITTLCYSPNGKWILGASTDKTVSLWKTVN